MGVLRIMTDDGIQIVKGAKGDKGDTGATGATGAAGKDGSNGKDGVSATHSWNGTTLTVTSASGTSSANLKGEKGDKGDTGAAGKNGADGYTPVRGKDYYTEADKVEIVQRVIETLGGSPIFGIVDESNNIVVSGDLPDGTYSVKYEMENGSKVNIGNLVIDTNVYYTVTNSLTQCTNSNSATKVVQGSAYSATITAKSGYELKSVTATMGGTAVSVSNGKINIASVTGNIVITAVATEVQTVTNLADPTSADWKEGHRLSISSGNSSTLAGHTTTNFIPCKAGDVLRVKGMRMTGYINNNTSDAADTAKIIAYNSSKGKIVGLYGLERTGNDQDYGLKLTGNGDVKAYTILLDNTGAQRASSDVAYIRIDGALLSGYTKNDVVITINEEIA